jgi:hypothetical protein
MNTLRFTMTPAQWKLFPQALVRLGFLVDDFSIDPDPLPASLLASLPQVGVQLSLSSLGPSPSETDELGVDLFWLAGQPDALDLVRLMILGVLVARSQRVLPQYPCRVWRRLGSISRLDYEAILNRVQAGPTVCFFSLETRRDAERGCSVRLLHLIWPKRSPGRLLVMPLHPPHHPRSETVLVLESRRSIGEENARSLGLDSLGFEPVPVRRLSSIHS